MYIRLLQIHLFVYQICNLLPGVIFNAEWIWSCGQKGGNRYGGLPAVLFPKAVIKLCRSILSFFMVYLNGVTELILSRKNILFFHVHMYMRYVLYKYWLLERETWEIVTSKKPMSTKAKLRLTLVFLGWQFPICYIVPSRAVNIYYNTCNTEY